MKHMNTLCRQNVEFFNVEAGNHCALAKTFLSSYFSCRSPFQTGTGKGVRPIRFPSKHGPVSLRRVSKTPAFCRSLPFLHPHLPNRLKKPERRKRTACQLDFQPYAIAREVASPAWRYNHIVTCPGLA